MPTREIGGYTTSNAGSGAPAIREITMLLTVVSIGTWLGSEQSFTVPEVLATDRIAYVDSTSGDVYGIRGSRCSAALVFLMLTNGTSQVFIPTASASFRIGIASLRPLG